MPAKNRLCAPQLESAMATATGLLPGEKINIFVHTVTQEEAKPALRRL
jgi:hypothetical protein